MASDLFDRLAAASVTHMAALCGATFQVSGDASTIVRRGVIDRHKARSKSDDGGIGIEADAILVAPLDQFTDIGLPKSGKHLSCAGHRYVIVEVQHDQSCATLYLNGLSQ